MAGDLGDLAADLRGIAQRLGSSGARAMAEAAGTAGSAAAVTALQADVPSQRLRNLGPGGVKLAAGYKVVSDTAAEVELTPRGGWVLLDKGGRRHPIGVGEGKKGGRRRLRIGGRIVSGPVDHPGAPALGTLRRALDGIDNAVVPAVTAELGKVIDG